MPTVCDRSINISCMLTFQQIQETHAKKVCHKYRSVIKKMKEGGSNKYKKKIKELPGSVADAAKGLCRTILRYKGK